MTEGQEEPGEGKVRTAGQPPEGAAALDRALLERLLRFIEYRPRTKAETRERLRRWGYDRETTDEALRHLESVGLLDDSVFAGMYMDEMIAKGFGERRIREKLAGKRLDRRLIDEVLGRYPREDDVERAIRAGAGRLKLVDCSDPQAAAGRLLGYLLRKGYPPGVAREASKLLLARVDSDFGPE